ncbi:MAG: hypothetical protein ACRDBQ_18260 [Shewanella sp.]
MEHASLRPFNFAVTVPAIIYQTYVPVQIGDGTQLAKLTENEIAMQKDLVGLLKKYASGADDSYSVLSAIRYDGRKEIVMEGASSFGTASGTLNVVRAEVPLAEFENLQLDTRCKAVHVDAHELRVPFYGFDTVVKKVFVWASDRGIVKNGKWFTQATKMYEELGEIPKGIATNRDFLIQDGIGDALVVLVNVMSLRGLNLSNLAVLYKNAVTVVADNPTDANVCAHRLYHETNKAQCALLDAFWNEVQYPTDAIQDYLVTMVRLAKFYEMDVLQCFNLAWDEIKNRRGWLNADGIFVKE